MTSDPPADRFPSLPACGPGPPYPTPPAWYDMIQATKRVHRELGPSETARVLRWLAECLETSTP